MFKHRFAVGATAAALVSAALLMGGWPGVSSAGLKGLRAALAPLGNAERCARYSGLPAGFGQEPTAGMVSVPRPVEAQAGLIGQWWQRVRGTPRGFWIDRTEVTNAQFRAFVAHTGHVTQAEREGASAVFEAQPDGVHRWVWRRGADWRHPAGPGSDLQGKDNQPVVQVTLADARAYAAWLGHDLPTEAEWTTAALAGGQPERIPREPRDAAGHPTANFWQGVFPIVDSTEDGYAATAPVGCFPANGYGLHDLIGNVWELTGDRYAGPRQYHGTSDDEDVPPRPNGHAQAPEARVVIKGGSFLCSADVCHQYMSDARQPQEADIAAAHVGFRTVHRAP